MDDNYIMPFGKYKGKKLGEIPEGYFLYLFDRKLVRGELKNYIIERIPVLRHQLSNSKKDD